MEFVNAKTIIQTVKGNHSWFGASYNMNIYRGCNQGCIYCDSRSNCYQVHNFDKVKAKRNAPILIENELKSKKNKGVISMGSMSDPYNAFEEKLEYTKQALSSIHKYNFGVFIITKSILVLRDKQILSEINKKNVVNIAITITTANDLLQSRIERNVSSSSQRFLALKELAEKGLFTGILLMPILPFINDTVDNISQIIDLANEANVKYIYPSFGVTLRDNQRDYFLDKIGPELRSKYINTFKDNYMCRSKNIDELKATFTKKCDEYGILYKMEDIINESNKYVKEEQLALFQ